MLYVLGAGCWTQIGLAIIETVVIDVIDEHVVGHFAYFAVHVVPASLARWVNPMSRVEGRAALGGEPFAPGKREVVVRIDDGELALGQAYRWRLGLLGLWVEKYKSLSRVIDEVKS